MSHDHSLKRGSLCVSSRRLLECAALIAAISAGAPAWGQPVLFDFDNAPVHAPLPIDLTVGGITAHLSATGQGYSIQRADTMGFTPVGFGGLCIYPNSVFAADLLVSYSRTLTAFSIMFAPQELGCDDTATMRVTAYMDNTFVGTNTAHADPPGTWPTGTLSFSSTQGFNRVVVHYDARPPTSGDWGPIFIADNMRLTPTACTPAHVATDPVTVNSCYGGVAIFSVVASGSSPFTYRWERELSPNAFVQLSDGPTGFGSVISGALTGTLTGTLTITNVSSRDAMRYRCDVSNDCGTATSGPAMLTVCSADFNCDRAVNSQDFFDFLSAFFVGDPSADFNRDLVINSQDFFDFLTAFFNGCG